MILHPDRSLTSAAIYYRDHGADVEGRERGQATFLILLKNPPFILREPQGERGGD